MTQTDHSPQPPPGRAYTSPDLTVYYDQRRCIHFAACVRGLPEVFNTQARPWIQTGAAAAEQIAEVVRRCPTGALHYELRAGPAEQPEATSVEVRQNGPLFLRGDLSIHTADGLLRETRAALCRCGSSENKPLCDGSHRRSGFSAPGSEPVNRF